MIQLLICHNSYPAPADDPGTLESFDNRVLSAVEKLYLLGDEAMIKFARSGYIIKKITDLAIYYCLVIQDRSIVGWQSINPIWLAKELIYNTPSEEVRIFEIDTNYLDNLVQRGMIRP